MILERGRDALASPRAYDARTADSDRLLQVTVKEQTVVSKALTIAMSIAVLAGLALSAACGGASRQDAYVSPSLPATATGAGGTATPSATTPTAVTEKTVVATATGAAEPTATFTAPPTPPRTSPPAAATATPTSPAIVVPPRSFAVGEWVFDYSLTGNTCLNVPSDTMLSVTQKLEEVSGNDGYVSDGEQVRVYGFNGGPSVGLLTFRWPALSFQVPLNEPDGIRVEVTHTFADVRTGTSRVVEVYRRGTATCELTYSG